MTQTLAPAEPAIYRLSLAQYEAMTQAGILTPDDRIELIEGLLIEKMSKNPPHVVAAMLLEETLRPLLPSGLRLVTEAPVLTDDSLPEPDGIVLRGTPREYLQRRPGPADVPLVIEIADSTLAFDRGTKQIVYARAGFASYWIVNLVERQVEVYTDPTGSAEEPDYRETVIYRPEESVPLVLDGARIGEVAVANLLP